MLPILTPIRAIAWRLAAWALVATLISSAASAESPVESVQVALPGADPRTLSIDLAEAREAVQWLANLAIEKAPRTIHGNKDWGQTRKLWSGVKIRRDGWQLKTKRRYREAEQGRWIRFEVSLPAANAVQPAAVTVHRVEPLTDQQSGDVRWKIDSSVASPIRFTAQVQRWNLGVKLFSVTVTGQMQVRLRSSLTVGLYADYTEVPPALEIDPHVEAAHLFLDRFEVDRISNVGGDVAEGWGEVVQEVVVERLIKKQNERLTAKLNQSIDKQRDNLRLSLAQWFESLQP